MSNKIFIIEEQFDENAIDQFCSLVLKDTDGAEISPGDAFEAIRDFDHFHPNDPVQAFHLGLKEFNKLYLGINTYNQNPDTEKGMVIGVRFYRAITSRSYEGIPINDAYDLIIVPTYECDLNEHKFLKDAVGNYETIPMTSYLRPCPKLCGTISLV